MGVGPVGVLLVVVATLGFEGLLFGSQIADQSFPQLLPMAFSSCTGSGLGLIGCWIGSALAFVANVFLTIFGAAVFLFNLISFNVPGAPWFVRALVGTGIGGALIWSIASLFRGGS